MVEHATGTLRGHKLNNGENQEAQYDEDRWDSLASAFDICRAPNGTDTAEKGLEGSRLDVRAKCIDTGSFEAGIHRLASRQVTRGDGQGSVYELRSRALVGISGSVEGKIRPWLWRRPPASPGVTRIHLDGESWGRRKAKVMSQRQQHTRH